MERLTKRGFNFTADFIKRDIDSWSIAQALTRLQKYEDLEEQDLLLKLLCKAGDTVYVFKGRNHYTAMEVNKIEIKHTLYGGICYLLEPVGRRGCLYRYFEDDFGKAVFLTQAEAGEAIQKMNETEGTTWRD